MRLPCVTSPAAMGVIGAAKASRGSRRSAGRKKVRPNGTSGAVAVVSGSDKGLTLFSRCTVETFINDLSGEARKQPIAGLLNHGRRAASSGPGIVTLSKDEGRSSGSPGRNASGRRRFETVRAMLYSQHIVRVSIAVYLSNCLLLTAEFAL